MDLPPLAFVDLETSGVSPADDRVTEIGIVLFDDGRVTEEWSTLVNPGVPIPPAIQALTGITNAMVRHAPGFAQVLPEVQRRLSGRVFVAHNARFDYGFVKAEFRRAGARFTADVLCTVRLSRRLFPQYGSHRLDSIIDRHGLRGIERHRALGDARAIQRFVAKVWHEEDREVVSQAVRDLLRQPATPPHLRHGATDTLPESPGVYVFVGASGQPLYVGKARNLRERVRAHFYSTGRNANEARLASEVHDIRVEQTSGEFSALLHEIQLVKSIAPLYNVALRRRAGICFLEPAAPGRPPRIVPLAGIDPLDAPLLWGPFGTRQAARAALAAQAREHRLCERGIGAWTHEGPCFSRQIHRCDGYCVGVESAESHHERLLAALDPMRFPAWPFDGPVAFTESDPDSGRSSVMVFDRWRHLSAGSPSDFDPDVFRLLRRAIERRPASFRPAGAAIDGRS